MRNNKINNNRRTHNLQNRASGAGQVGYKVYQDDWNYGYNAQHKTAEVAGGALGAWGGAVAGAKLGGILTAPWGGWGAIPGGIIGAVVFGCIGAEAGGATYRGVNK